MQPVDAGVRVTGGHPSENPTENGGEPSVKEKKRATDYCCCNEVQAEVSSRTFVVAKEQFKDLESMAPPQSPLWSQSST